MTRIENLGETFDTNNGPTELERRDFLKLGAVAGGG